MNPAESADALQRISGLVAEDMQEVIVTGARRSMAVRENLADYQLYRLPGPTDLSAHQTKQVAFLHRPEVKIERFYGIRLATDEEDQSWMDAEDDAFVPIDVKVGWRNRKDEGLGEPLPGGLVRFFEVGPGGNSFIGAARIQDSSVNTPVEVTIAKSVDLGVTMDGGDSEPEAGPLSLLTHKIYLPIQLRFLNDKSRAVVVEVRQGPLDEFRDLHVVGASLTPKHKAGDYLWRLDVPAHGEAELRYRISGRVPDYED